MLSFISPSDHQVCRISADNVSVHFCNLSQLLKKFRCGVGTGSTRFLIELSSRYVTWSVLVMVCSLNSVEPSYWRQLSSCCETLELPGLLSFDFLANALISSIFHLKFTVGHTDRCVSHVICGNLQIGHVYSAYKRSCFCGIHKKRRTVY